MDAVPLRVPSWWVTDPTDPRDEFYRRLAQEVPRMHAKSHSDAQILCWSTGRKGYGVAGVE